MSEQRQKQIVIYYWIAQLVLAAAISAVFFQGQAPLWLILLTVALIIGLYSWNEFLIATTFLQRTDRLTAVVSFFLLSGQYTSDWGEIMAAALIIVLPVIVLFIALQRRFIEGIFLGLGCGYYVVNTPTTNSLERM